MNCCQPFWLTQMRVVAGVTEEGEYQGVEGDRAVLGDLDLREGELTLIIRKLGDTGPWVNIKPSNRGNRDRSTRSNLIIRTDTGEKQ